MALNSQSTPPVTYSPKQGSPSLKFQNSEPGGDQVFKYSLWGTFLIQMNIIMKITVTKTIMVPSFSHIVCF